VSQDETVATKLETLREGLERRGVTSPWGPLKLASFDAKALSVTLSTSNYLFFHRHKTRELVVPILELSAQPHLTLASDDRRALAELTLLLAPAADTR